VPMWLIHDAGAP